MTDQREILERVANGELSPAEAAELLDEEPGEEPGEDDRPINADVRVNLGAVDLGELSSMGAELREMGRHLREEVRRDLRGAQADLRGAGADLRREVRRARRSPESFIDDASDAASEPLFPDATVDRLQLLSAFRTVVVVADPTVRTVAVEGPHRARLDGSTLVIDGDDETLEGFRFESRQGTRRGRHFRLGVDNPRPVPLRVRANPSLALLAEVAAGSLKIAEMRGPITAEVAAGALSIAGASGPLDLSTAAGPIKVQGRLTTGTHRIRCEAGAVKVILDPASSVRIHAKASLGKVVLPGVSGPAGFAIGSADSEATIGDGEATLAIECSVGGVKVVLEGDDR